MLNSIICLRKYEIWKVVLVIRDKSDKRQYVGETGKTLEERVKGHLKLNSVR